MLDNLTPNIPFYSGMDDQNSTVKKSDQVAP